MWSKAATAKLFGQQRYTFPLHDVFDSCWLRFTHVHICSPKTVDSFHFSFVLYNPRWREQNTLAHTRTHSHACTATPKRRLRLTIAWHTNNPTNSCIEIERLLDRFFYCALSLDNPGIILTFSTITSIFAFAFVLRTLLSVNKNNSHIIIIYFVKYKEKLLLLVRGFFQ